MKRIAIVAAIIVILPGELVAGWHNFPLLAIIHGTPGSIESLMKAQFSAITYGGIVTLIGFLLAFILSAPRIKAAKDGKLAKSGAFAYSRHPMYVSMLLLFTPGIGIMFNNWLLMLSLIAVEYEWFRSIINREEDYLIQHYGDEYLEYQKRVGILFSFGRRRT